MRDRTYKDTLFRSLFGTDENKSNALELYNAVNGTAYNDPEAIELTTVDDVVFMNMKNDVSFAFHNQMMFWEHQSTQNRNMPLRFLLYMAEVYSRRLKERGEKLSGSKPVLVEAPRFVVFYNGSQELPDRSVARLSDSFLVGEGDVELTVTILNVNQGRNRAIMDTSQTLAGYARLVALIREKRRSLPLGEAIESAIDRCMREGVLVDYLRENRQSAVMQLLNEDFNEVLRHEFDYGVEQGIEQGIEQEAARFAQALRDIGVEESVIRKAQRGVLSSSGE